MKYVGAKTGSEKGAGPALLLDVEAVEERHVSDNLERRALHREPLRGGRNGRRGLPAHVRDERLAVGPVDPALVAPPAVLGLPARDLHHLVVGLAGGVEFAIIGPVRLERNLQVALEHDVHLRRDVALRVDRALGQCWHGPEE